MKKLLVALFTVGMTLAYCADIPTIANNGTFTSTGVLAQIRLQGQSSVSVTNTGGSGNVITVQASNDCTTNWQAVGTVATGNTATFAVGSTNSGLLCMRLNVTTYVSGTGVWWSAITATVGSSGGSGGSSTVTCASPGCTVIQGTSPWVVNTAPPPPTPAGGVYPITCAAPGQNPCAVTTPAPAATNATDSGINVHIANTTAIAVSPGPLATPVDPCANPLIPQVLATATPSSNVSGTLFAGSSGKIIHVCSLRMSVPSIDSVIVGQTTTGCSSPTTIVEYTLQSGIVVGYGREIYPGTGVAGDSLCYTNNSAVQVYIEAQVILQ